MVDSKQELESRINEITQDRGRQDKVKRARKKVKSDIKQLNKELENLFKGAARLRDYYDEMVSEGVEKAAKKGKLWFKSLQALGDLASFTCDRVNEYELPENKELSYDEFKVFVRDLSNLIHPIQEKRLQADKTMGLDFIIKKRQLTVPLAKIMDIRDELRDFLKDEYKVIRLLENLETVKNEILETEARVEELKTKIQEKEDRIVEIKETNEELEQQKKDIQNTGIYSKLQQMKIDLFNLETSFGQRINPLRKDMRTLWSKASEVDGVPFQVATTAQNYEEDVIKAARKDYQNDFEDLKALLETMVEFADEFKYKNNHVNRFKNLLTSIDSGNIQSEYKEIYDLQNKINELESSDERIAQAEQQLKNLDKKIENNEQRIKKVKKDIQKLSVKLEGQEESLEERKRRFNQLEEDIRQL